VNITRDEDIEDLPVCFVFLGIGCAGEVGVGKDEDYAKWGIEIRVKFR
jgi:hypothetical protein